MARTAIRTQLADALSGYLLTYASLSSQTTRAKRNDAKHLLNFMQELCQGKVPLLADVTPGALNGFIRQRLEAGDGAATVRRRMATIKHFCRAMSQECPDYPNRVSEVRSPRCQQPEARSLSEDDALAVRAAANMVGDTPFKRTRNHALVEMAFMMGLRCLELAQLTEGQLDEDLTTIRQLKGKGNKFCDLPIPQALRPTLTRYLIAREATLEEHDAHYKAMPEARRGRYPLFVSLQGAERGNPDSFGMAEKTIWRVFRSAGDIVGLERTHPHVARHTFCTNVYRLTGDLAVTRRMARHESISTTARYLEPRQETLRRAFDKLK